MCFLFTSKGHHILFENQIHFFEIVSVHISVFGILVHGIVLKYFLFKNILK
jgi:hypothetical protein